jgi:hypothetical protein
MNTNRFSRMYVGLLILAVALVSVSFATMNNASKKSSSNTYLPLPPGKQTQLYNAAREARILYHRSSSKSSSAAAAVYLDYAQRHPELSSLAALGQGASDYADRHPELSALAASFVDQSDYYLRHPELSASPAQQSIDLTDYYFRHLNRQ